MTESTPPNLEQFRRLNRDLMEKVIDRAASDPGWKQRLLDDPEAAIEEADFTELRHLWQLQSEEVAGQALGQADCRLRCMPVGLEAPSLVAGYLGTAD
jgi:hypothetical protein